MPSMPLIPPPPSRSRALPLLLFSLTAVPPPACSKLLPSDQHSLVRTQTLGTVQYMPPELLSVGRLSRATDIFGLGIISEALLLLSAAAAAAGPCALSHSCSSGAAPAHLGLSG